MKFTSASSKSEEVALNYGGVVMRSKREQLPPGRAEFRPPKNESKTGKAQNHENRSKRDRNFKAKLLQG